MVVDALTRKERAWSIKVHAVWINVKLDLIKRLQDAQREALLEENLKKERLVGQARLLTVGFNGVYRFRNRVWIPSKGDLRDIVLDEAHKAKYTVTPVFFGNRPFQKIWKV